VHINIGFVPFDDPEGRLEIQVTAAIFTRDVFLEPVDVSIIIRQIHQQVFSKLTEKDLNDHGQLLQMTALFPLVKHVVYDQGDQQHFDKNERHISEQINENVMRVPENQKMDKIHKRGQKDHDHARQHFPIKNPPHKDPSVLICVESNLHFNNKNQPVNEINLDRAFP
jgi:hypothetical protein